MSPALATLVIFSALFLFLALGLPVVFCVGGLAVVLIFFSWDALLVMVYANLMSKASSFLFIAIPLFIFMASMMERSGVAENLYHAMYRWIGGLKGGLAMGTMAICTLVAAIVGESGTATVIMGVTALPSMLKRGYDKQLVMGSIAAGGTLGALIPPSIIAVVYAFAAEVSPLDLWYAGYLPGLLLAGLFIAYIGIRCYTNPKLGPALPPEEWSSWKGRFSALGEVTLPILLVALVLGSIYGGVATPTEASAVGALGALFCAALNRRLNWKTLRETCYRTLGLTAMIIWIIVASESFRTIYAYVGAAKFLQGALTALPLGRWGILFTIEALLLLLGCPLDPYAIVAIAVPVFVPVVESLGFDLVWFGVLFVINMEMAELTPPVGLNIFYMRKLAPEDTTMGDIYRAVVPFVLLQGVAMGLIMLFPQIALWLPGLRR